MAAPAKRIVLITGAASALRSPRNSSPGPSQPTYHVLLGARSATKGAGVLSSLQSLHPHAPGTASVLALDVTSDASIAAAAAEVHRAHGRLDVLVNNAGTAALEHDPSTLAGLRAQLSASFDVNATGVAVVTEAFGALLKSAAADGSNAVVGGGTRIINISSGAGSIAKRLDPTSPMYPMQVVQYRASKAALNMVAAWQQWEFGQAGIKVFTYDPGFTVSNLGPPNKVKNGARPASKTVGPLVELLEGARDAEEFGLLHNTGMYPW